MQFGRISINSNVCHGQACVKGTGVPVHQIVGMLANGDTIEDLLAAYPFLSREDIMACLDYAANLAEEQITPFEAAKLRPMRILVDENISVRGTSGEGAPIRPCGNWRWRNRALSSLPAKASRNIGSRRITAF